MERRPDIGLGSYDRFFPNQDTLPKGGFGNLIALPLQKRSRESGNSVFLDEGFAPYPDQWAFLSTVRPIDRLVVETIVRHAEARDRIIGVRCSPQEEDESEPEPWAMRPSHSRKEYPMEGPVPAKLELVLGDGIYIAKDILPPGLRNRLLRLSAFQNPEFYRAQAMRLPTYDKPRIISCAEDHPSHIGLPRGCLDSLEPRDGRCTVDVHMCLCSRVRLSRVTKCANHEVMSQSPMRRKKSSSIIATKDDWIAQALHVLVTEGVDAVLVLPLAKTLRVSRSSFYWYFKNREDILDHLLKHWMNTNTQAIVDHAARPSRTIIAGVLNIFECWISEATYSPRLDIAVRNWARQSTSVRRLVKKADNERVEAIKLMYARHGFSGEDAFIRARVLYYMQVGYYALNLREPMEIRLSHVESYLRAFTNEELLRRDIQQFVRFADGINAQRKLKGRSGS